MIYTSCFTKYDKYKPNIEPISIAVGSPYWFKGKNYLSLTPSKDLLKRYKSGETDKLDYLNEFNQQLKELDVEKVYNDLDGKLLLCWEKTGFCHRHIIKKWFKDNGFDCEERCL